MDHQQPARVGDFCWVDCAALDPQAAKEFYAGLFGWTYKEDDNGGMPYITLQAGDTPIGGLYELMDEQKAQGVPPNWLGYIKVEALEPILAKAGEHGGNIVMEPCEVPDHGRLSVLQDPTGATFALWESAGHDGTAYRPGPGVPVWFECLSTDLEKSVAFYSAVFGWTAVDHPTVGEVNYKVLMNGEQPAGGCMQMGEEFGGAPSHWMIYFHVEDPDATVEKIAASGGNVMVPPIDIDGVGRFAVALAPDGAAFSVIRLAPQPA